MVIYMLIQSEGLKREVYVYLRVPCHKMSQVSLKFFDQTEPNYITPLAN